MADPKALVPRLERFALGIAQGMSKVNAYKEAHPASRAKRDSMQDMASKLAAREDIRQRVNELLRDMDPESVITLTEHLRTLKTRSDHCWAGENGTLAERYDKQIGAWLARFKDAEREDKRIASDNDVIAQLSHGDPRLEKQLRMLLKNEKSFEGKDLPH